MVTMPFQYFKVLEGPGAETEVAATSNSIPTRLGVSDLILGSV